MICTQYIDFYLDSIGAIDSANNAVLSVDFQNNALGLNRGQTVLGYRGPSRPFHLGSNR